MSHREGPDWPDETRRLDDRVLATLEVLSGEIAFNGLRRALGAHPESLTRTLRRLERDGLVERVSGAYRARRPSSADGSAELLRPVAQVELPAHVRGPEVLARLTGRWFGSLRWVGAIERPEGRRLAWARRDGTGIVVLETRGRELRVSALANGPIGDPDESEDAAYELLYHAVDVIRTPPPARPELGAHTFRAPAVRTPLEN